MATNLHTNDVDASEYEDHSQSQSRSRSHSEHVVTIGQTETTHVCWLKSVLGLVLFLATAGVSISVFRFARGSEKNDFETQYYDHALKLTSSFEANAKLRLNAIESFAVTIASSAKARGE